MDEKLVLFKQHMSELLKLKKNYNGATRGFPSAAYHEGGVDVLHSLINIFEEIFGENGNRN